MKVWVIMIDGELVLRLNNYSLIEGESSVFDKEFGAGEDGIEEEVG